MLKRIFSIGAAALLLVFAAGFTTSCDKGESGGGNRLSDGYFTVESAAFNNGSLPAATTTDGFANVEINNNVLAGGSSIITIESAVRLTKFYVGVDGVDGYYSFDGTEVVTRAEGDNFVYTLTILLSQNLGDSFTINIAALTADGKVTPAYDHEFTLVNAGTGALQVSLSFSNSKDIDLYLVLPDGHVVYYGEDGDYDDQDKQIWGLDVDSNPACYIDDINNENIFFPKDYVMNGKYTVYVNMYENCNPSTATSWAVTAHYKGNLITPSYGNNPQSGTLPVYEPNNEIGGEPANNGAVKVMEFTISGAALNQGDLAYPEYDEYDGGTRSLKSQKAKK